MASALLDPWNDASEIGRKLEAGSRLAIVIGAEAWCTSCQILKPVFETLASDEASDGDIFLWLDLEEHAEFLDEFVPPSLPLLMVYDQGKLTHGLIVTDFTFVGLADLLTQRPRIDYEELP